jgi:hypothetical protein
MRNVKRAETKIPYDAEVLHDDGETWAVAHHDGWSVTSRWDAIGGRGEPVLVTIARDDGQPIGAGAVRRLPLGEMFAACRQQVATEARRSVEALATAPPRRRGAIHVSEFIDQSIDWKALAEPGPRRGKAFTNDDLKAVAAVYRRAWDDGLPVTAAVADAGQVSRSTAAKRIMRARAAGLLEGVGPQQ